MGWELNFHDSTYYESREEQIFISLYISICRYIMPIKFFLILHSVAEERKA